MRRLIPIFLLCFTTSCVHAQGNLSVPMSGRGTVGPAHGAVTPPCAINPVSLPDGVQGTVYTPVQLTASNCAAPAVWSVTGSLPAGLSLSSGGLVSGTPSGSGSSTFTITLVDNAGHAPTFPVSVSITSAAVAGTPLAPDTALSTWDTSMAGTPTSNITDCVGTPLNASLLPGGGCATNQAGTTAGAQAALNAVACGHVINFANIQGLGALTLPSNKKCANNAWIWLAFHDLSDPVFPAEGTRPDPCYIGIPQTAMPFIPYPLVNATPNTCSRHMSQIIVPATSNNPCLKLSTPTSGTNTPSIGHWRIMGLDCTRDQSSDALTALIDLNFQPAASGQDCALSGSGNSAIPTNPTQCATDQYDHIVLDRYVVHGDAQRQTVRALSLGGGTFLANKDYFIYDIQDTFAGGQGDAQSFSGGFGHGYTGVGNWIFNNGFSSSSTEGQIFCGAFTEPTSPVTKSDGIPTSVIQNLLFFYKPILWDTQRGSASGETLLNEGIVYPPQASQEVVWQPTAFQVQQGLAMSLNNTWLNDSSGGWNRFNDVNSQGTVTVDGVTYTTLNSANGIVTKSVLNTLGSAPWQITNTIQWSYTACSGAGVPVAACTGATTPGVHTLVFTKVVTDDRAATLGNNRSLSTTITATVTSGAPTNQIALTPSAPDLQIQPSYSDSFGNNRNFAYVFQAITNFASISLTWKVDGIANGNTSVGRICSTTAVPCVAPASNDSRVVYVSGTGVGSHTISVTSAAGTTTSQAINVTRTSPIWGYDLKAMTVKNMWETKCIRRMLAHNLLLVNTHGSQGNGGGQYNSILTQSANNGNQTTDGSGASINYGPETISDLAFDHVHVLHGGGIVAAALNVAMGLHRVKYSHVFMEDINCPRYGHGFTKCIFADFAQVSGTAALGYGPTTPTTPGPLPWSSALNPLVNDLNFSHITMVGGTAASPGVSSWLSLANNKIQFQLGPFSVKDSIFTVPASTPFFNNNGEVNDYNTASGSGVNNTEAKALDGTGYSPATPMFSAKDINRNLLLDNTTAIANFTSTIWQAPSTSTDVFRNYNPDGPGDYRVPPGSQYAAGGARCSSDGCLALGADIAGITANDEIIRWGNASPLTITTATLPDATHGVSYSQTLAVTGGTGPYIWTLPGGPKPPGSEDILDYAAMPSPDRNNFHLSGTIVKYFKIDAGLLWWIKGASGNPQDGELIGPNYIHQWFTEGASFTNASGFKMYLNPPPLWKRYHKAGDDDVVYAAGPNNYSTTANCGADGSPQIDNLGVRGELTGPFTDVTWQTTYGGSIPDNTPYLLAQKWIKCTANDITTCTNEEDYWLVKGYGQVRWCPKTWNGTTYVTGTCTQETTKVAGGAPTPNFACGVPTPTNLGLPTGTTRASAPPMSLGDTTGTISGTLNTGNYSMTVQVEDSLGRIAQRTLTLNVN